MKRILYTMPAVMVVLFYGMLALLAGGFASFQVRAWLMILMPVAAAVLLVAGRWWGSIFGMLLGGGWITLGLHGDNLLMTAAGILIFGYYLVMGIVCLMDNRRKSQPGDA